jgi:hypothetical protein
VARISPDGASSLQLYYTVNGEKKYDYRVELEPVASNLPGSSSSRYYMICPYTGRRATVLYLRSGTGIFAHRDAFASRERLYYDSQLEPKRFRGLGNYFAVDRIWEEQYRRGRKKTYRGKPTKWYAALLELDRREAAAAPALLRMLNGY